MIAIARAGKYIDWIGEDGCLLVQGWARDGLTDEQIASNIGVSYSTFREWLKKFPALQAALKIGKAPVDLQVENALLKRALGYDYQEVTCEDGKPVKVVTKHMAPDTTAQIFWLKNRRPDRWRDRVENAPAVSNELLTSLMILEKRDQNK